MRSGRRITAFVGLAVFLTLAFIGPGMTYQNPNVFTRMALTLAIIEDGTLRIDRAAAYTTDKAAYGGHFYSDKAPGSSLLAVPLVAALRLASQALGRSTATAVFYTPATRWVFPPFLRNAIWLASIGLSATAAGLAAMALARLAIRLGCSPRAAGTAAIGFGLGTPIAFWGTTFFGHALAAGLLFVGFERAFAATDTPPDRPAARGFLAGFLLGLGLLVEFTNGPATLLVAAFGLNRARTLPADTRNRLILGALAGGLLALLPLPIYNTLAFDAPFRLGYGEVVGFDAMHTGFYGINLPHLGVIYELLFGAARGLVWVSPLILLGPLAFWTAWRHWPRDLVALLFAVPLCFLLINAGYAYWNGGASAGPRHLTAGLAFACLPLALLWDRAREAARGAIEGLIIGSIAITLVCASVTVTPLPLPAGRSPLLDTILPAFLRGGLHNMLRDDRAPPGHATLAVIPLLWLLAWLLSRALAAAVDQTADAPQPPRQGASA